MNRARHNASRKRLKTRGRASWLANAARRNATPPILRVRTFAPDVRGPPFPSIIARREWAGLEVVGDLTGVELRICGDEEESSGAQAAIDIFDELRCEQQAFRAELCVPPRRGKEDLDNVEAARRGNVRQHRPRISTPREQVVEAPFFAAHRHTVHPLAAHLESGDAPAWVSLSRVEDAPAVVEAHLHKTRARTLQKVDESCCLVAVLRLLEQSAAVQGSSNVTG